jgi:glucose/arabinose dehydrogenase
MKKSCLLILIICSILKAQYPTYSECSDLTDADFEEVTLFSLVDDASLAEPMRKDFYVDEDGDVNVYFVEREGKMKYYDAGEDALSVVGELDVWFSTETGLLGIALDPDFNTNRWVYLFYMPTSPNVFRIARFVITEADNTLDLASETIIMDVPDTRQGLAVHTGGGLYFDHKGDLWVTMGEHDHASHVPSDYHSTTNKESSNEDCSSDTYSLYGSILRIHPQPDGSYTIPEGNFGEYWSQKFESEGRTLLAEKYADTDLVRPEIWAKGFRNPMSVQVDPVTGWVAVSECGGQCHKINPAYYCPEHGKSEKHMLITEPSFQGWSYFHADNHPYVMSADLEKDPMTPVNNSPFRLGVDTLPPAVPATYFYGLPDNLIVNNWICSVGGYTYRYDGSNPSPNKFPPHFDGKFLISDLNQSFIRLIEVDDNGQMVSASDDLFTSILTISHTMDLRQGPDGSMYLLNYSQFQYTIDLTTGLYKINYTGDCAPVSIKRDGDGSRGLVFQNNGYINAQGPYTAEFYGINGEKVFTFRGTGKQRIPSERLARPGVYQIKVTENGKIHTGLYTNMR